MKDSQPAEVWEDMERKYIKANNERFSTKIPSVRLGL